MHASDIARLRQREAWNREAGQAHVAPGSTREAIALAHIDQAREDELAALGDTQAQRRKRHALYWGRQPRD